MNRAQVAAIMAVSFLASTSLARAQGATADETAIRAVLTEYRAAINPLDTARLRAIHAPGVIVVDGGVVSRNRDVFLKTLQTALRGNGKGWKFTAMDVVEIRVLSSTTALALTTWEGGVPGRTVEKGIWLAMLGKRGTAWRLEAWSSAAPAN